MPKKPVVVVDWHNTLEKDDDVSGDNLKMLSSLMDKCQVHILSYVQSTKRENEVLANMWRDVTEAQLAWDVYHRGADWQGWPLSSLMIEQGYHQRVQGVGPGGVCHPDPQGGPCIPWKR